MTSDDKTSTSFMNNKYFYLLTLFRYLAINFSWTWCLCCLHLHLHQLFTEFDSELDNKKIKAWTLQRSIQAGATYVSCGKIGNGGSWHFFRHPYCLLVAGHIVMIYNSGIFPWCMIFSGTVLSILYLFTCSATQRIVHFE